MPSPPNANNFYLILKGGWKKKKKKREIFSLQRNVLVVLSIIYLIWKKGHIINDLRKNETLYRPNFQKVSIQVSQWLGTKYTPKKIENLKNNSCNQYK